MTVYGDCMLQTTCRVSEAKEYCHVNCYGYRYFHGAKGDGGILGLADIPKAYGRLRAGDIPFKKDNPKAYELIKEYLSGVMEYAGEGEGLYLYSIPNPKNPRGTGFGKTTATVIILNEFLVARVAKHIRKEQRVVEVPGMFVNVARFQNVYNSQFRGTAAMQEEAARRYYGRKHLLINVELLVLDDIGVRNATEAFMGELYEIIDERAAELRATLFTSNVPITKLAEMLDERIASRVEGMTWAVPFEGLDKRKKGVG